mmetsp:Transcript_9075/g.28894  ORF Transcript_9075/g.28894 Transcript_9075/m.28894 type:complete len:208 (-) Transcript_9075:461-1084(-)
MSMRSSQTLASTAASFPWACLRSSASKSGPASSTPRSSSSSHGHYTQQNEQLVLLPLARPYTRYCLDCCSSSLLLAPLASCSGRCTRTLRQALPPCSSPPYCGASACRWPTYCRRTALPLPSTASVRRPCPSGSLPNFWCFQRSVSSFPIPAQRASAGPGSRAVSPCSSLSLPSKSVLPSSTSRRALPTRTRCRRRQWAASRTFASC